MYVMHPVNYLFEDIYRGQWGIGSNRVGRKHRSGASPWVREPGFLERRAIDQLPVLTACD